jgi:hypothetical protein
MRYKMCEIKKEELLKELEVLMMIPNFKNSIYHKIEEIKGIMREDIDRFNEILTMLDEIEPKDLTRERKFTIEKREGKWIPSIPGIPEKIINFIVNYNPKLGEINMLNNVEIDSLRYTVNFEKTGKRIINVLSLRGDTHEKRKQAPTLNPEMMGNVKLLFQYIFNNESLCNSIISEFLSRWKPLVDRGCMQVCQ